MSEAASVPRNRYRGALVLAAAALVLLLAGAVGLWVHYGTAVFYETIIAGITACL